MSLDIRENRPTTKNTPPLQTAALLTHTLCFMPFENLLPLNRVSKLWKQLLVTVVWKLSIDTYLKTHFFTPDDVKAFTTDEYTDADIWSNLKELSESKGFASNPDLDAFRSDPINLYSINQSIRKRIGEEYGLLLHQRAYLRSARVIQAIMGKQLTLEEVIAPMLQVDIGTHEPFLHLGALQMSGLYLGFTFKEVAGTSNHNVFSRDHLLCALMGHKPDEVTQLDCHQAKSLREKTTSNDATPAKMTPAVCL